MLEGSYMFTAVLHAVGEHGSMLPASITVHVKVHVSIVAGRLYRYH